MRRSEASIGSPIRDPERIPAHLGVIEDSESTSAYRKRVDTSTLRPGQNGYSSHVGKSMSRDSDKKARCRKPMRLSAARLTGRVPGRSTAETKPTRSEYVPDSDASGPRRQGTEGTTKSRVPCSASPSNAAHTVRSIKPESERTLRSQEESEGSQDTIGQRVQPKKWLKYLNDFQAERSEILDANSQESRRLLSTRVRVR